jgi:hypothetical protein
MEISDSRLSLALLGLHEYAGVILGVSGGFSGGFCMALYTEIPTISYCILHN